MKQNVIWITGFSGAGKTTTANALKEKLVLENPNLKVELVDGDEIRKEIPKLGFSIKDRMYNVFLAIYKTYNYIARNNSDVVIVSLISPLLR